MNLNWKQVTVHLAGCVLYILPVFALMSWLTFGMPAVDWSQAGVDVLFSKLGPVVIWMLAACAFTAYMGKSISRRVRPASKLLWPMIFSVAVAAAFYFGLQLIALGHVTLAHVDRALAIAFCSILLTGHFALINRLDTPTGANNE
jgi:hypothetical protein